MLRRFARRWYLASFHSCFGMRRIWAQNPSDAGPAAVKSEVVVENVA